MIALFLKIRSQVSKGLTDLGEPQLDVTVLDVMKLENLESVLDLVAAVVHKLSERDCCLFISHESCQLLVSELDGLAYSQLKNKMVAKLSQRLSEDIRHRWRYY